MSKTSPLQLSTILEMLNGSILNAAHWMSLEDWKENLLTKLSSQRWQVNICNISKYMLEGYITHIYPWTILCYILLPYISHILIRCLFSIPETTPEYNWWYWCHRPLKKGNTEVKHVSFIQMNFNFKYYMRIAWTDIYCFNHSSWHLHQLLSKEIYKPS